MTDEIDAYVERTWGKLPQANADNLRAVVQKYGDNRWWESDDPAVIAQYQLFESTLVANFDTYMKGAKKLLGRPVWNTELYCPSERLKEEAKRVIALREGRDPGPVVMQDTKKPEQENPGRKKRVADLYKTFCEKVGDPSRYGIDESFVDLPYEKQQEITGRHGGELHKRYDAGDESVQNDLGAFTSLRLGLMFAGWNIAEPVFPKRR